MSDRKDGCGECPFRQTVHGYCTDALKRAALDAIGVRIAGGGLTQKFSDGWTPDMPLDGQTVWRGRKV